MKKELEQTLEFENEDTTKFIPFRLRRSYWSNTPDRIMIPNVVTVIPPDVSPDLLPILLYRIKLEEIAYKAKNLDTQAINTAFLENKLDLYLFPEYEDALLSKAYESLRVEKHNIIKEIDKALPPVLPPPIILPPNCELSAVRPIKRPFRVSSSQNQDSPIQNQSDEYEYSEDDQQQAQKNENDEQEKDQENENFDSNFESEYYTQQPSSKNQYENFKDYNNLNQFGNPLNNSFSPYKQSYDNQLSNTPQFDEAQSPQSRSYMDNMYENTHLQQKQPQPSQPPLQYQEPYNSASPYSNSSYRYNQSKYDDYNSSPKQHQIPPPPSFISQSNQQQYPPPVTQKSRDYGPLPPPPPITQQQLSSQQPRDFGPFPPPPPITQQQRSPATKQPIDFPTLPPPIPQKSRDFPTLPPPISQKSRDFPTLPPPIPQQSRDFGPLPPPPPITQQQHIQQRSKDFSNLPPPPPPPIPQQRNYAQLPIPPPPPLFMNDRQQDN